MRNLHHAFSCEISNSFNVLDTIDLFEYDSNLYGLINRLSFLKKDVFASSDKIVFLHFDTDFYLYQDSPGMLLTNLHLILTYLDIPFSFVLLITNHQIDKELEFLRVQLTTEPNTIPCIVTNFQQLLVNDGSSIVEVATNVDNLKYPFSCLNGAPRTHRKFLMSLLAYNNLLAKGLVSYGHH